MQPRARFAPYVFRQQHLAAFSGDLKQYEAPADRARRRTERGQVRLMRIVNRYRDQKGIHAPHDGKPSGIQYRQKQYAEWTPAKQDVCKLLP